MASDTSRAGVDEPIIQCTNVSKMFGTLRVLNEISLTVSAGEMLCIIGPSGGGKSTLLRVLNGLEPIGEGKIVINGITLPGSRSAIRAVRREVGMVFQNFNLFPHLSVRGNLTLAPRRARHLSRSDADKRALGLLSRVRLADKIDRYPAQLSGGEQQRVAIARALALEPRVLLFDEPTSALDPEMVGEVLAVMRELVGTGITMLVVTHEMGFAREIADRILFMDGGQLVYDAPPKRFFSAANEPRIQSFLSKIL